MDIKNLLEKYKAGETTLEEEEFLRDNASEIEPEMAAWFKFAKHQRKQSIPHLEEKIWRAIDKKTARFTIAIFAAAASILLLAVFVLHNKRQEKLAYMEKEALLNEALAMMASKETKTTAANIIYEDDLVIIYTNPE